MKKDRFVVAESDDDLLSEAERLLADPFKFLALPGRYPILSQKEVDLIWERKE
jgi:hypothetical protein